jgi:hypothetical protein
MESAAAVVQIVLRFVGFNVLVEPVDLNVAARDDHAGIVVIFHVIGAQPHVLIVQIDVSVGVRHATDLGLLLRLERSDGSAPVLAYHRGCDVLFRRSRLRSGSRSESNP